MQGDVDLKIIYDDDVYGARVLAQLPSADEDTFLINHLIAMQTLLSDNLEWSAYDFSTDPPAARSFRVKFEDSALIHEFKDMFAEGMCQRCFVLL